MNPAILKNTLRGTIIQVVLIVSVHAQDSLELEPQHLLCLSSGRSTHVVRDEIISPMMYRGSQFPVFLSYRYRGAKSRELWTAYFENLQLTSSITNAAKSSHYVDDIKALFEYWYCRNAFPLPSIKTECYIGGNVSGLMNWKDFYYLGGTKATSLDMMICLGLDALFETTFHETSPDFVSVHFHVPILSYVLLGNRYNVNVTDTDYGIEVGENIFWQTFTHGDFVTLNRLFELRTEITYTKFLDTSIGIEFQYRFHFYRLTQYTDLFYARYLNNQFLIGLVVQL